MAERLGLPATVVADARARRDDKEQQAEALLARLEQERSALEREKVQIEGLRAEAQGALARTQATERELAGRKRREVELFAKELRRRGEEAERKADEAVRAAVERVEAAQKAAAAAPRLRAEAIRAIREARDEILRDPQLELPEEEAPLAPLAVGTRVRVKTLGIAGEVLALHGSAEAEVAIAGKRLRVARTELVALQGARSSWPNPGGAVALADLPARSAPAEINLVGLTVEEALPKLDKLLDDAFISDRREIRVIHGFGEGKLRRAVAQMLEGHPHVSSWRMGQANEGGGGATVVELKD
jgi:DNA mismatch repair protein MutS2